MTTIRNIITTISFVFFLVFFYIEKAHAQSVDQKCIISNGVPNHKIGTFPTKGNPNKFRKQNIHFCFTTKPKKTNNRNFDASVVGITLTGIPIRPGTAGWYDGSSPRKHSRDSSSGLKLEAIRPYEKILGIDDYNGHVDHRGLYHYHKTNLALLLNDSHLIGYAADGFEILYIPEKIRSSWQLKKGNRNVEPFGKFDGAFQQDYEYIKGSGDLDECNGMLFNETFRYFATENFPFFPRCHWGEISKDFVNKRR